MAWGEFRRFRHARLGRFPMVGGGVLRGFATGFGRAWIRDRSGRPSIGPGFLPGGAHLAAVFRVFDLGEEPVGESLQVLPMSFTGGRFRLGTPEFPGEASFKEPDGAFSVSFVPRRDVDTLQLGVLELANGLFDAQGEIFVFGQSSLEIAFADHDQARRDGEVGAGGEGREQGLEAVGVAEQLVGQVQGGHDGTPDREVGQGGQHCLSTTVSINSGHQQWPSSADFRGLQGNDPNK